MELIKNLRNNFIFVATKALDKRIDGRTITQKIDEQLDQHLGKKSEAIQRGPLSDLLMEMVEGLWEEDLPALRMYLIGRIQLLPKPKEGGNGRGN